MGTTLVLDEFNFPIGYALPAESPKYLVNLPRSPGICLEHAVILTSFTAQDFDEQHAVPCGETLGVHSTNSCGFRQVTNLPKSLDDELINGTERSRVQHSEQPGGPGSAQSTDLTSNAETSGGVSRIHR